MKKNYTEIALVIDNSGSMKSIQNSAELGLKTLIDHQRSLPGECKVSLVTFNTNVHVSYFGRNISDVQNIEIKPMGYTALFDAVGIAINRLGDRLRAMPEQDRPEHVLVTVVTDGMENASKTFNLATIADMIAHQENKYNWKFIFIGVGKEDVFDLAEKLNIKQHNTMSYTPSHDGVDFAYKSLSGKLGAIRSGTDVDISVNSQ